MRYQSCDSHFYQNVLRGKDQGWSSYQDIKDVCNSIPRMKELARPIYNHAISLGTLAPKSYHESKLPRWLIVRDFVRSCCLMLFKNNEKFKQECRTKMTNRMIAEMYITMNREEEIERKKMNKEEEDKIKSEEEREKSREIEKRKELAKKVCLKIINQDYEVLLNRPIPMKSGGFFITRRGRDPSRYIIDYVNASTAQTDHVPYRVKISRLRSDLQLQSTVEGMTNLQLLVLAGDVELNPGPRTRGGGARGRRRPIRRRAARRRNGNGVAPTRLPNSVHFNSIMPSRKFATLKYLDGSTVRNNPGGSFLVYSMRINDLYDPDPAILSGSVSNFKEMMQFYSFYRVLNTSIEWSVVNLEVFPLSCGIVFSQTNLTGVISSLADCQNAMENDFVVPLRTISGTQGMNRTSFNVNRLRLARLLGAGLQYRAESNYSGLGLATPAIPLWANFIVFAPSGASMTNGYVNNTTLYMASEFFGRLNVRS